MFEQPFLICDTLIIFCWAICGPFAVYVMLTNEE